MVIAIREALQIISGIQRQHHVVHASNKETKPASPHLCIYEWIARLNCMRHMLPIISDCGSGAVENIKPFRFIPVNDALQIPLFDTYPR